ncbi:MAG TPA: hypothetical protein VEO20_04285 [Thermoplasmata archaeon]|nr:hypothetical protein [Thermoplasmata archaeon]
MALRRGLRNWLLAKDADPSVRVRVLRDLLERPEDDAELVRAQQQIGRKGWAAKILREQHPHGQWATSGTSAAELYRPKYVATNWRLLVLSDLGLTKKHPRIAKGMNLLVRRRFLPAGELGRIGSEVCITGNAVRMLLRFGYTKHPHLRPAIDWLVRYQKKDGGWHCFRSSTGTLDCWEALAAFAALPPASRSPEVHRSIERGAEFYLSRALFREGATPYRPWFRLHYPVHYYYDLLVGLDVLTSLGYGDDRRMRPALDRLEAMRNRDGSWNLDALHPDTEDPNYQVRGPFYPLGLEVPGRPSRWITTTALTVLQRAGR